MARMQRSLFAQLNALAEEISQSAVKSAAEKKAAPVPADPGGYQGASSHPTTSADNDCQKATEGARAAEYEADIKKQQGALAVDNTPEMSQEGRQDDVQLNIGTSAKATGEDPSSEKDFKGDKDDPGTTSPVKANDGEKYSAVNFKVARQNCSNLGNDILANLINFGTGKLTAEKAAEMPAALQAAHEKKESPAEEKAEHAEGGSELKGDQHKLDVNNNGKIEGSDLASLRGDKAAAFKAGYELAEALGLDKEAAEASVRDICANTIREADEMADLFIGFMRSKAAAEEEMGDEAGEGEDHSAPGDDSSGASDAPAGLEAMMGGDAGGAPEAAGAMGGAEGAPSEDETLQELAMALEELGIPPEALLQAVEQQQGGGGAAGGMSPEAAGGMPPEAPKMASASPAANLDTIGRAVVNFKRAGKFQIKEARTKKSRELRDAMKQHVAELLNR